MPFAHGHVDTSLADGASELKGLKMVLHEPEPVKQESLPLTPSPISLLLHAFVFALPICFILRQQRHLQPGPPSLNLPSHFHVPPPNPFTSPTSQRKVDGSFSLPSAGPVRAVRLPDDPRADEHQPAAGERRGGQGQDGESQIWWGYWTGRGGGAGERGVEAGEGGGVRGEKEGGCGREEKALR